MDKNVLMTAQNDLGNSPLRIKLTIITYSPREGVLACPKI
jgi:hypothetical protein